MPVLKQRDVVTLDAALFFDRVLPLLRERAPQAPLVAFTVGERTSNDANAIATVVVDEATFVKVLTGRATSAKPAKPTREVVQAPQIYGDRAAVALLASALRPASAPATKGARDVAASAQEDAPMRLPNGRRVKGRRPTAPTPPSSSAGAMSVATGAPPSTTTTSADPVELAIANLAAWLTTL